MTSRLQRGVIACAAVMLLGAPTAFAAALGPTPYLQFSDSPFSGGTFSYFFLETFEDHLFNVPSVSASAGGVTSVVFGPSIHDSVDADDGVIDGSGLNGDDFFSDGATGISFTFASVTLGGLPTHAGIVWTDGSGTTTFQAFDADNNLLGTIGPVAIANSSFNGETDDDRFFGFVNAGGISRIFISNTQGGIEVDHLQYGRVSAVPLPAPVALLSVGLATLGLTRRRLGKSGVR